MAGKQYVIVKGRKQRMSELAFQIASAHFGATKPNAVTKEVPIELLKLPNKEDIIKAQPKEEVKQEAVKEAPKAEPHKRTRRR